MLSYVKRQTATTKRAVPCHAARQIGESNRTGRVAVHRATPHLEPNRIESSAPHSRTDSKRLGCACTANPIELVARRLATPRAEANRIGCAALMNRSESTRNTRLKNGHRISSAETMKQCRGSADPAGHTVADNWSHAGLNRGPYGY